MISFRCPECRAKFKTRAKHVGRRIKCPTCSQAFVVGVSPQENAAASAARRQGTGSHGESKAYCETSKTSLPREFLTRSNTAPPEKPWRMEATDDTSAHSDEMSVNSPLSETELEHLVAAEVIRRRIRHAACWFRFQYLGAAGLTAVIFVIVLFMSILDPGGAQISGGDVWEVAIFLAIPGGWTVLCYHAYGATWNCQSWAPITMLILHVLAIVVYIIAGLVGTFVPGGNALSLVGAVITSSAPAVIAFVCYRAWAAIPDFLEQPKWCQETLEYCGL